MPALFAIPARASLGRDDSRPAARLKNASRMPTIALQGRRAAVLDGAVRSRFRLCKKPEEIRRRDVRDTGFAHAFDVGQNLGGVPHIGGLVPLPPVRLRRKVWRVRFNEQPVERHGSGKLPQFAGFRKAHYPRK